MSLFTYLHSLCLPGSRPLDRISTVKHEAVSVLSSLSKDQSYLAVHNCILARLSRLICDFGGDRNDQLQDQFRIGDGWVSGEKQERRLRHIELMVLLVKRRESFGPGFWASIARWQVVRIFISKDLTGLLTLNFLDDVPILSGCTKLLEDYISSTRGIAEGRDEVRVFIDALEKAVQRAYALPVPEEGKTQLSDVFSIRTIYNDPDVWALVTSERFSPEKRLELQRAAEELLIQQPMFPPDCYALQRA